VALQGVKMQLSPILLLHICSGLVGLFSGAVAMCFRKGSKGHRVAGNTFVVSMLSLAGSGVYLALIKSQPGNVLGGALTFYLVATAWTTARRRNAGSGIVFWGAFLAVLAVLGVATTFGVEAARSSTGLKHDYPPGPYFFLAFVALVAVVGDVRMLVQGGVFGAQRVARHLWRMCFALFIASTSIFLARQQLFPPLMRKTGALVFLSFLPLAFMAFWLIRVRFKNLHKERDENVIGYGHA
jgi:uncharacterized membrane protein